MPAKWRNYRSRPSTGLCASAGMPRTDSLDHFYLTKCTHCPEWTEKHNGRPIAAARHACEHAQRHPGHAAYVINIQTLSVVHRYQFDAMIGSNGPTDDPPF